MQAVEGTGGSGGRGPGIQIRTPQRRTPGVAARTRDAPPPLPLEHLQVPVLVPGTPTTPTPLSPAPFLPPAPLPVSPASSSSTSSSISPSLSSGPARVAEEVAGCWGDAGSAAGARGAAPSPFSRTAAASGARAYPSVFVPAPLRTASAVCPKRCP